MDFSRYRDTSRCRSQHAHRRMRMAVLAMLTSSLALPALAGNPGYDRPGYGFTPVVLGTGDITIEQGLPDWSRSRQNGITRRKIREPPRDSDFVALKNPGIALDRLHERAGFALFGRASFAEAAAA